MVSLIALVIFSSEACTSDADKLTMLKADYMTYDLVAQHYREKYDSLFLHEKKIGGHGTVGPLTKAYADSAYQAGIKRDLAERELNRFMR